MPLAGGLIVVLAPRSTSRPGPIGKEPRTEHVVRRPAGPSGLEAAPPEVRTFLDRVLEEAPAPGPSIRGYRFHHWQCAGSPTQAAFGIKALPGLDPEAAIARILDLDHYEGRVDNVESCRALPDPPPPATGGVPFHQVVAVPGIAKVQHVSVLVDAGTIRGYRVAYWYLLPDETNALDPKTAAQSASNIGAWLAAPGVLGYALHTCPRREDVNALQWVSLTTGADGLAERVIERNLDGLAAWANSETRGESAP